MVDKTNISPPEERFEIIKQIGFSKKPKFYSIWDKKKKDFIKDKQRNPIAVPKFSIALKIKNNLIKSRKYWK